MLGPSLRMQKKLEYPPGLSPGSCADPESFIRGGPNLTTFLFFLFFRFDEGRKDQNTTFNRPSSTRQQNAIYMAFRWQADDGPALNAGLVAL